jgi:hypothetical protein
MGAEDLAGDRVEMLIELADIGRELERLERQFGRGHAAIEATRERQQRMCAAVLAQLRALLVIDAVETIH